MRVLSVITHGHLPQLMGGIQTVVDDLNQMLSFEGHSPAVLAQLVPRGSLYVWNRVKSKLPPRSLCPVDHVLGYPTYRGWDSAACETQAAKSFCPDVAVVHGPTSLTAARTMADLGIPTILYLHGIFSPRDLPPESRLIRYVANSHYTAEMTERICGIRCPVVIPLMCLKKYTCDRRPQVITMVNPIKSKGVATAIGVAKARSDISFLFVKAWQSLSSAENEATFRDIAKNLPNVTLIEPVRDMRTVYRRTKILLMPSDTHTETYGRTAVEAQVSGIPVIGRRVGGLPEAMGDGGTLMPPSAPLSDWVTAVSDLWDSEEAYQEASKRALLNAARVEKEVLVAFARFISTCKESIAVRDRQG